MYYSMSVELNSFVVTSLNIMCLFKYRGNVVQVKEGGWLLMTLLKCLGVRDMGQ